MPLVMNKLGMSSRTTFYSQALIVRLVISRMIPRLLTLCICTLIKYGAAKS